MKKYILLVVTAIFVLQFIDLNAQENRITYQNFNNLRGYHDTFIHPFNLEKENQKSKETIAKPEFIEEYSWENMWEHERDYYLKYDDNGNLIEDVISTQMQDTVQMETWMYDEYGNLTQHFHYVSNNGNLVVHIGYNYLYEYDEFGHVLKSTYQKLEDGIWVNRFKSEFELGSQGEWIGRVDYSWENEEWTNSSRLIDIVWYNWDKWQVETITIQYWEDEWVNSERYKFAYTGDNYISIIEIFQNGNWIYNDRKTYTISDTEEVSIYEYYESEEWIYDRKFTDYYNEYGDLIEHKKEVWENYSWILTIGDLYLLTYNENDELNEKIWQHWYSTGQVWENFKRYLYSDYQYFDLGTLEIEDEIDFELFPNPANDFITIDLPGITKEYNVHIFNILGQEVYKDQLGQNNKVVDIHGLPDGLYIVQVELDGNKAIIKKFMKQ